MRWDLELSAHGRQGVLHAVWPAGGRIESKIGFHPLSLWRIPVR